MKKFISLLISVITLATFSATAFATSPLGPPTSMPGMPFVTQDIPDAVKEIALDYKTYCTLDYSTNVYTIDSENALVAYKAYDDSGKPVIDTTTTYYTFNIMMGTDIITENVVLQMTVSYDGQNAQFVSQIKRGPMTMHGRTDGFRAASALYENIYDDYMYFAEYLKSINSTDKPILVKHNSTYYIYEQNSNSLMAVDAPMAANQMYVTRGIFSVKDIKNYVLANPTMNNQPNLYETMALIDPIYGEKYVQQSQTSNGNIGSVVTSSSTAISTSGGITSSNSSTGTNSNSASTSSSTAVPNVDTGYGGFLGIFAVLILSLSCLFLAKKANFR